MRKCSAGPPTADRPRHRPVRDQRGVLPSRYSGLRRELGIDHDKPNVSGGAIAIGRLFGLLTGARVTTPRRYRTTLQTHLTRQYLASETTGRRSGGRGRVAMVLERHWARFSAGLLQERPRDILSEPRSDTWSLWEVAQRQAQSDLSDVETRPEVTVAMSHSPRLASTVPQAWIEAVDLVCEVDQEAEGCARPMPNERDEVAADAAVAQLRLGRTELIAELPEHRDDGAG